MHIKCKKEINQLA